MKKERFEYPAPSVFHQRHIGRLLRSSYVVSSTLDRVDWNAELLRGDLREAVEQLKREPGKGLFVGGVTLPQALVELGLIDEYEFVVPPRLVGHGRTLFAWLSKPVDLRLVSRFEFRSGAVAMRYEPRRIPKFLIAESAESAESFEFAEPVESEGGRFRSLRGFG